MKWLIRHRRTFIVIALVTTPLCTVGYSGANFSASVVNPNNRIDAAADFVAPVVTLTAPTGQIANHFPTFTGAAGTTTGDLPTVTLKIWSGSTTTGPAAFTYTGSGASGSYSIPATSSLADGTWTAQASQTDTGSNTGTSTAITFVVDTVAPTVTLVNPINNALINTAATTFSGAAGTAVGDATTVTVRVYTGVSVIPANLVRTLSAPVSAGSWTINAAPVLTQGVYTVQATQSDTSVPANTTTTAAHTFTLDTTKPTATAAVIAAEDTGNPLSPNFVSGLNAQIRAFRVYANVTDTGGSDPTLGTTTAALTGIIVAGTQNVTLTYHAAPVTVGGTAYNWYSAVQTAGSGFAGTKNWTVTPTDQAGNVGTALAKTVAFDSTAPNARNLTNVPVLTGTAVTMTDPTAPTDAGGSGLNNVQFQQRTAAGPGAWNTFCTLTVAPWTCPFNSTTVPDGSYNFQARALDNAANIGTSTTIRTGTVDNTAPTVTLANPGATISAATNLSATFGDGAGTGVKNIVFERSPHLANTWTQICTANNPTSPRTCAFTPTVVADGTVLDFRARVTDGANPAFTTASAIQTSTIDYGPRGTDIQANVTNNTIGNGDVLTFTFDQGIQLSSVVAGWTTGTQAIQVRAVNNSTTNDRIQVLNAAGTVTLPFGTVNLNRNFVGGATTGNGVYLRFTGTLSTNAAHTQLIVTLTSAAIEVGGATSATPGQTANMTWTPSATITDPGGHAGATTLVTETGTLDQDF
jgi:Bacterial Ig-like domain/Bacterial Ig-like domain (group 3)